MRKLLVVVFTLLLAQQAAFAVVQRVVISAPQPQQVRMLAADGRLDILRVSQGSDIECFADDKVVAEYRSLGYAVTVKMADAPAYYRQLMARMRGGKYAFGPYYTYPQANQKMDSLHLLYPSLVAARESIGVTRLGKIIYAFSLTNAPADKPGVLFTGQHHAREPFGCNMAIEFARYLCQNYGTDSLVAHLVNNRQFWFVPVVNVDGSVYNSDTSADGMWRKNRRDNGDGTYGVDINRNYPYMWGYDNVGSSPTPSSDTYRGPSAGSEPEVQAVMNLMDDKGFFRTALNYHTYSNLWVLPWAYSDSYPVDSALIVDLSVEATSYNGYTWGTPSQTVGYTVNGASDDWMYETSDKPWKCLAMTPEVGAVDFYEPDNVPAQIAENIIPNLLVSEAAGVYLMGRTVHIAGGDGNQVASPGETINLGFGLRNQAVFDTATNVSATLYSSDPMVSIIDPAGSWADVGPRTARDAMTDSFAITIDSACPSGHVIQFSATLIADGGYRSTHQFGIKVSTFGTVSGHVTEIGTGRPLTARIDVFFADSSTVIGTCYSDSMAGGAYTISLPCDTLRMSVAAAHHKRAVRGLRLDTLGRTEDFVMTPTSGDILVINDHDAKGGEASKVVGYDKSGAPIVVRNTGSAGEAGKAGESAAQMGNLLGELGYSVTSETSGATNAATWSGYDVVVWSCGRDQSPLSVAAYRTNLIAYVNGGGKLLLEGGEIAYDWDTEDAAFSSGVMHANDWDADNAGALTLQQAGHPLATTPNGLPASLAVAYGSDYGDQDASKPTNNGVVVYGTTSYPADGGIIAYDNDGDPTNGQVVYYLFNMTVLADSATRGQLLENTMEYLLRPSAGPTATLSGVARLSGQSDHSGIVVTATLGGTAYSDTTDAAGSYSMAVYDGTYLVTGAKAGYVDTAASRLVTVAGSGSAAFVLYPVVVAYENDFEGNNGGLTGTGCWEYGVPTSGPGSSHSGTKLWATTLAGNYPSSSNSTLTLPVLNSLGAGMTLEFWHWHAFEGTTTLYDGGNVKVSTNGGSTWAVVTPAGGYTGTAYASTPGVGGQQIFGGSSGGWLKKTFSLAPYAGQNTLVRLHFGSDGSVNYAGWYVDDIMVYGVDYTGVAANPTAQIPRAYSLNQAYPNPFRDHTQIKFGLPNSGTASLAVYNIAGQKVATLVDGPLAAGYHTVTWNGRATNGQRVSGGIYFYQLITPDHQETRRLVYVR